MLDLQLSFYRFLCYNSGAHCPLLQCLFTTNAILAGAHSYFVVFKSEKKFHVKCKVTVLNISILIYLQDNPQPSRCLGIFGLSIYTTEQQLHHIMSKYGPVERVQVVIDAKVSITHNKFLISRVRILMTCHLSFLAR